MLCPNQPATPHGVAPGPTAEALAAELERLAEWLGLAGIVVGAKGDLAPALRQTLGQRG